MKNIRSTSYRILGTGLLLLSGLAATEPPREVNGCLIAPSTDCRHVLTGLKYSNLVGADLSGGIFDGITFHGASLREANLRDASLVGVEFDMASLAGADLRGADLSDAYLSLSDISDVDLRGAKLTNVNLRNAKGADSADLDGAHLCNTRMPDGGVRDDHCP